MDVISVRILFEELFIQSVVLEENYNVICESIRKIFSVPAYE